MVAESCHKFSSFCKRDVLAFSLCNTPLSAESAVTKVRSIEPQNTSAITDPPPAMLSRSAILRDAPAIHRSVAPVRVARRLSPAQALLAAHVSSYQARTNNFSTTSQVFEKYRRQNEPNQPASFAAKLTETIRKYSKKWPEVDEVRKAHENLYKSAGLEYAILTIYVSALIMVSLALSVGVWVVWKRVAWVLRQLGVLETAQSRKETDKHDMGTEKNETEWR